MKTKILVILLSVFTLNVLAVKHTAWRDKYCADIKDGKLTMMNDDKVMTADVTLENGTIVTTDGNIVKKDGTKTLLKAGQCVNSEGVIMQPLDNKVKKDIPKSDEPKKDY